MVVSAQKKWVSCLALSGIILAADLSIGTIPSRAAVKQQAVAQVLNPIETSLINSEIIREKVNRTNFVLAERVLTKEVERQAKNQENSLLSEQPETNVESTKVESQVKPENRPAEKTDDKQQNVSVASNSQSDVASEKKTVPETMPKASQQVSRGSSETDKLISRALSLQGIPYRWGGTTRDGFDCSGFVQYVFKASGVSLPRTSYEQYKVGVPVSRDQLKPGDLVFFSTYKPGASDVRIYIGGGRTIGASSDGVAIHSLSESYWSEHYLGARKVF